MSGALRSPVLRRFALAHFLLEVQFWFPVYLIFLLDMGFTLAVAVVADGLFRLVSVACEVPMGVLADRIGRRRTYLLLAGLTVAVFLAISQVSSVPGLFAAWIGWGVLWALASGASTAYLYELAVRDAPSVDPARSFAVVRALGHLAVLLSLVAAGYLYDVEPTAPFTVTAVLAAIALAVAWTLPETSAAGARSTIRSVLRDVRRAAADERVRLAVLLGALLLLLGWSPRILFQPLALELDYSAQRTGWMYAAFAAAAVVAGLLAGRVGPARRPAVLRASFLVVLAALVGTGVWEGLGPFLFLPVLGLAYALGQVLLELVTSEVTSPAVLATAFSVVSMLGGLGIAVARPALGLVADNWSTPVAFGAWAAVGALLVAVALLLVRRLDTVPART
ncbi:MFS transporter [Blastococcus saxobsidens]|uniref:MFS transporter n=1 Tax=Blastococcus saxobsidens TaxID=138336 RepID=A0A6L9VZ89_9ACTN|nr:MFS transporter [Blastococcus saxobsidens]NEK84591.1 MFS transporter [Blastococcus saxobsidens]